MGNAEMTESKWTPGPWHVERWGDGAYSYGLANVVNDAGEVVVVSDVRETDADLIAAAPEMYLTLSRVYDFIADQYGDDEAQALEGEFVSREARGVWNMVCDVMVKARGEK